MSAEIDDETFDRPGKPGSEIWNQRIWNERLLTENRAMNVEDLIGIRVWMKRDQFRSVSGIISSVSKAVNRDDLKSSIMKSIFRIDMPSGDTIQVPGAHISKFDHESSVCKKVPEICDDKTVNDAVQTSSTDELLKVA